MRTYISVYIYHTCMFITCTCYVELWSVKLPDALELYKWWRSSETLTKVSSVEQVQIHQGPH